MPSTSTALNTLCIPKLHRHPLSPINRVARLNKNAANMPIVMASWNNTFIPPRMCGADSSALYTGIMVLTAGREENNAVDA